MPTMSPDGLNNLCLYIAHEAGTRQCKLGMNQTHGGLLLRVILKSCSGQKLLVRTMVLVLQLNISLVFSLETIHVVCTNFQQDHL